MSPAGLDMRIPTQQSDESEVGVNQQVPSVTVKPGYKTTQGIFTGVLTLGALALSFLGFKFTPAQVQNAGDAILHLGTSLGPIVALIPVLTNYINSRGKTTSNQVWANAQLQNPLVSKDGISPLMAQGLLGGGGNKLGDILSTLGGGSGVKDPQTWIGLTKIAATLLPGGSAAGKIIGKVTGGSVPAGAQLDPKDVEAAMTQIVNSILETQHVILFAWNNDFSQGHPDLVFRDFNALVNYATSKSVQGTNNPSPR